MFRSARSFTACVFFLLMAINGHAASAQGLSPGAGALDGMIFAGQIGSPDNPDFAEELHFDQGLMWSKMCVTCGFQPAPYWTRQVGDKIHVVGELRGASGSVFRYDGVIGAGVAEVSVRWTKRRWYWSIDKSLMFRGTLVSDRSPNTVARISQSADAAAQEPLPDWCP